MGLVRRRAGVGDGDVWDAWGRGWGTQNRNRNERMRLRMALVGVYMVGL